MKIYGASYNLSLFEKHVVPIMEEARFFFDKALPFVEIYLGEIFREDALNAKRGEIFVVDIDEYIRKNKKNAGVELAQDFFRELGRVIRDYYLPAGCKQWVEFEKILQRTLDHDLQQLPGRGKYTSQAFEVAADLFIAALLGKTVFELKQGAETEQIAMDFHRWRRWFYNLWGQTYEWGSFTIDERTAEANGILYEYVMPPSIIGETALIQPCQLLEAHGFIVVQHSGNRIEYWR